MLAGLPCVATKVGDTEVLGGDTLRYVSADDASGLAYSLLALLEEHLAARQQIGQRCRARVVQQFSIGKVRQLYRDLYRQVVDKASN